MTIDIIWEAGKRKLSELTDWEKNPRKISEKGFEKLKERIQKRGFHDVIKIDVDGTILSGHMRRRALVDLGIEEVNVLVPSRKLTDEEREKVALESNRNDGEWDWDALAGFDVPVLVDIGFLDDEMRINFGLSEADGQDIDVERFDILAVLPPETGRLKDRAAVEFKNKEDYDKVKKWLADNGSTVAAEALLKLAL